MKEKRFAFRIEDLMNDHNKDNEGDFANNDNGSNEDSYQTNETARIKKRVGEFNWKKSKVWKSLSNRFGDKITQEELISIAELLANTIEVKLDRDARRRKVVLIKWFEENWAKIEPLVKYIILDIDTIY